MQILSRGRVAESGREGKAGSVVPHTSAKSRLFPKKKRKRPRRKDYTRSSTWSTRMAMDWLGITSSPTSSGITRITWSSLRKARV